LLKLASQNPEVGIAPISPPLSVITLSDGIGFEINEGMAFRPDESALNVGQFGTLLARWKRFSEA
jgi:hypothetical protein